MSAKNGICTAARPVARRWPFDFINDLEFEGGEKMLERAVAAASRAAELKRRAKSCGVPIIYVNDDFGRWQSNFNNLIEHCLRDGVRGRSLVQRLLPEPDDYFVPKPKHSDFFSTTLDVLLDCLHARTLVLTATATNVCVYGQRRLHVRLLPHLSTRLRCCVDRRGASLGARSDGGSSEGRHESVYATGFRTVEASIHGHTEPSRYGWL